VREASGNNRVEARYRLCHHLGYIGVCRRNWEIMAIWHAERAIADELGKIEPVHARS
jgi:hypothetical protein